MGGQGTAYIGVGRDVNSYTEIKHMWGSTGLEVDAYKRSHASPGLKDLIPLFVVHPYTLRRSPSNSSLLVRFKLLSIPVSYLIARKGF